MRHRRLLPTALTSLFVALVSCSQQAPPAETSLAPTVSTTIERRVVAKTDDAEETVSNGEVDLNSSDLELAFEGSRQQTIGIRFTNVNIPQGATITKAYVQFTVDETRNDNGALVIKAQATNNAPTFAATTADISSRPTTSASVNWTPAPWTNVGAAGVEQQTPNLKSVVQAVVNRGGWTSGNALAVVITGSGRRVAESFNGSPANAPLLHVEYESDGAPPPAIQYTLTVNKVGTGSGTVTGPGISCGGDCTEDYNGGTQVTLTAAPASDSSFAGWSGACTGTGTCTVTMNAAKNVTASFSSSSTPPTGEVTIEKRVAAKSDDAEEQPSGAVDLNSSDLELVFDGSKQQTVGVRFANLNIPQGATITKAYVQFIVDEAKNNDGALVIKGQAANTASTFTATANNISSRPTTGASVNWTPAPWTVVGANGPAQRTPDLKNIIQEIVSRGGWTSGNALAIVITGSGKRVAESFNGSPAKAPLLHVEYDTDGTPPPPPNQYALSVNKTGAGSGTVSGPGINCGGDCTEDYNGGTQVTLTAAPASDSSFAGWSGACSGTGNCTVTMNAAKNVTASFSADPPPPSQRSLTVNKTGSGSGTVTGPGINCGSDCAETYNDGTNVTLVAAPASGSSFSGWGGACSGTGNCTVTMNAAKNVTASFSASPPPTGQGSITTITQVNQFATGYSGGTSSGSPLTIPSTDPAGIVYHPPSGHLFISDSEINEISSVYSTVQANVFEVSLNGNTLHNKYDLTTTANGKQREPTGIGYCPGDNRFYVSHDNTPNGVWRYGLANSNVNFEDQVNTPNARDEDPNTKDDPEDVVCDPATGLLYVINGVNLNILVYSYDPNYSEPNPGPSARVSTTSFKLERNIDLVNTAGDPSGIPSDTEGIGFDPVSKHLFVTSAPEKTIYEFTTAGRFVKKFNISGFSPAPLTPQGITIGPSSNGSGKQSFYIADGGVDNDKDAQERDGRIYEAVITRSQ